MRMNRRELFRKAGLGVLAAASTPVLLDKLALPVLAQGQTGFTFLAFSAAGGAGTAAAPQHRIAMGGTGKFGSTQAGAPVDGGGQFVHHLFPGANPPPGGTPLTIVATGTWEARRLVSYKQLGTWGVFAAGILETLVDLFETAPARRVIRSARLKIVCSIGPAGLINPGESEGFVLSIPGTDFFTGGTPGPFVPIPIPGTPGLGLTVFTVA